MDKEEIQSVLNAPVSFVRLATNKEKEVFSEMNWFEKYGCTSCLENGLGAFSYSHAVPEKRPLDSKDGYFLTFGLTSGQNFVGYVPKQGHYYRFRLLEPKVPHLREIVWDYEVRSYHDSDYVTRLHFLGYDPSKQELEKSYSFLVPPYKLFLDSQPSNDRRGNPRKDPVLLEKAKEIQKAYAEVYKAKQSLILAQKKLNAYLLPSKTEQLIQQKLKERRQNG